MFYFPFTFPRLISTTLYTCFFHSILNNIFHPLIPHFDPGSQDKTIRLWRTSDLAPIASLSGHKRGIWKVVFSPVDRCLASCSGDRTVRLWSVVDYTCLRVFEGHTASVLTVKFANKGMQLLSGAADGLIRLWTIRSGECENTFDLHSDRVWALAVGHTDTTEGMYINLKVFIVFGSGFYMTLICRVFVF